jgi:glycine cleavage system H protein
MATIYFTKDHEWISVDGDEATVGITEHAQEQLGDLVFVELPQKGRMLRQGEEAVVVESVKAASDVYAPVAGEVTAVNGELSGDPALVNRSAEGEGWLFRMKVADRGELDGLMDRAAYQAMVA